MGETSPDQICKHSTLCPVVLGGLRPPLPPTDQPRLFLLFTSLDYKSKWGIKVELKDSFTFMS